jgi:putative transposase
MVRRSAPYGGFDDVSGKSDVRMRGLPTSVDRSMAHRARMPNYRRYYVPGGTFFFTVNLADRRSRALTTHIDALRAAFRETKTVRPFEILAIVVMPNHLHCIWTLPESDTDNARRWSQIKSAFSRRIAIEEVASPSRSRRRERGIWQRRFRERCILDEDDLHAHIDYIHHNPVKHGFVACAYDWPHSSFRQWVAAGTYPIDWAADQ